MTADTNDATCLSTSAPRGAPRPLLDLVVIAEGGAKAEEECPDNAVKIERPSDRDEDVRRDALRDELLPQQERDDPGRRLTLGVIEAAVSDVAEGLLEEIPEGAVLEGAVVGGGASHRPRYVRSMAASARGFPRMRDARFFGIFRGAHGYARFMARTMSPNLAIGSANLHNQTVVEHTDERGTDHEQYVYVIRCDRSPGCASAQPSYRINGSNFHERKCPRCQDGEPGL